MFPRNAILFTHDEVDALLQLINDVENDYIAHEDGELTIHERSAKEKLKKIYARQILSHEKRQRDLAAEERSK